MFLISQDKIEMNKIDLRKIHKIKFLEILENFKGIYLFFSRPDNKLYFGLKKNKKRIEEKSLKYCKVSLNESIVNFLIKY